MSFPRWISCYPGWTVLAGSFVCAALTVGFSTYVFGMFLGPVTEEFSISRASYNNGMIVFMVAMTVISPLAGRLLDQMSAQTIIVLGGLLLGGSLMLMSRSSSLWMMLVLIAIPLTFGFSVCGMIGANTVVVRWFQRRRGRVLGVLAVSTSTGGLIAQPLTAWLIDIFGWRDALFIIGLVTACGFLLAATFLIRNHPTTREPGYTREFLGNDPQDSLPPLCRERVWRTSELLRHRNFWLVALAVSLLFAVDQAVLISQVPYFLDIGFDLKTAALLVSVQTISAIGGKLLVGYLADRIDLRFVFMYVAGSTTILMLIYSFQPSFWALLISVAFLGVAIGGVFPAWTTLLAWLFGPRSYGTIMGLMAIVMQPFAIVAVRFIGATYDRSGSYVPAFGAFIVLAITAAALVWLVRREPLGLTDHSGTRQDAFDKSASGHP